MEDSYYRRLGSRAWRETKAVWTPYRCWFFLVPPIGAVLLLLWRNGWRAIMNWRDVLLNAAGGGTLAGLAFLGTIVISLFRTPKLLDAERVKESEAKLQSLNNAHQDVLRRIEVAHEETRANLKALRDELAIEREKNQKPEIRVEILEGFFQPGPFQGSNQSTQTGWGATYSDFIITLCIRLVNLRPVRTSITKSELIIEDKAEGAGFHLNSRPVVVPHPHSIERDTIYHEGQGGLQRTVMEDIPDLDMAGSLEYGVATVGLVQFIIPEFEVARTENDDFRITPDL